MDHIDFLELADQYLKGEMDAASRASFEVLCASNSEYARQFALHKEFLEHLNETINRKSFMATVDQVSKAYHIQVATERKEESGLVVIWRKLRLNAGVAAAVAVISAFSTLLFTGYFSNIKKATSDYSALRREMNTVKRNVSAHTAVIKNINDQSKTAAAPMNYGATGFVVSKEGYVVTNYHVINGADSIHLQNSKGFTYTADIIYTDPEKDLAILFINDTTFKSVKNIPYTFKKQDSNLGEDIFTLGFPRDEAVYGQGYLSSATGYGGDTSAYQISIPVNPGNSGGPVLDNQGNIIGIISGKQKGLDGAAFAIKTSALLATLNKIPEESLKGNIVLNNRNLLGSLSRTEQIKRMQDFVYIVKVY